jgi:hypothetical protein
MASVNKGPRAAGAERCIHLSPGTPAMTAVWVLLGKSRYPATFYQSLKGRVWRTDIPFDLAVDYVPELFRAGYEPPVSGDEGPERDCRL